MDCDYPLCPCAVRCRTINMDARAIHRSEAGYPARLHALGEPPTPLWIRGDWTPARRAVALVGARAATAHGLEAARELGARLASAGVDVISGGALGVDAAAHRGALDVAGGIGVGHTVAVLGTGIDVAYPERNAGHVRARSSASGGALVTQFAPGVLPRTAVVSGAQRGDRRAGRSRRGGRGAAGVGHDAHGAGDAVAARARSRRCPDRTAPTGSSCRARSPVSGADDVLARARRTAAGAAARSPEDPLAAKIYAALDDVPRDVGELAFRAGLAVGTCAAMVVDLELGGLAARAAGGRYLRLR